MPAALGCTRLHHILTFKLSAMTRVTFDNYPPPSPVELETKVKRRFAKVSIVSYSRPSLMIIVSASQFTSTLLTVGSTSV